MNTKKRWKIAGIVAASILLLIGVVAVVLATFDWNRAKPWLDEKISEATERSFEIRGDLSMGWRPPVQKQDGIRGWIPWPHLRAIDIRLGNPDWAATGPTMAHIQQMDFPIDVWPLLTKTIRIPSILLTGPDLILEKGKDNRNNWTFPKREEAQSRWTLDIRGLGITHGTVRYVDPGKKADATANINTFEDGSVKWTVAGKFNDEKISGNGNAGALLSLQSAKVNYPVQAFVKVGETTITADGTLTDPAHLSALDIKLKIIGASMSDLFPLSGVVLPSTPKFSTEGRVVGSVVPGKIDLTYDKFKGEVGSSDIGGTLEYLQRKPRSLLRGKVVSKHLHFNDLGAIVGAGKQPEKQDKKEAEKIPPGKVLPVEPFKTERWRNMDVQVEFSGEKIIRGDTLPIDDLYTKVVMEDGVLLLHPLNFGVAGGRLQAELRMDGTREPASARMKVTARGLKLAQLFPKVEEMKASLGQLSGNAELSGAGNSVATLLASSDGEVKALISEGTVSKFILEAAGLNIGSVVVTKLFGDKQVKLNCMAADFGVKDGLMDTRTFLIDTSDAAIHVNGNISFAKEELNLKIRPEAKGVRLFSLRSPLYVKGTFKNPDAGVDKGVLATKAGAAALLGTVAAPVAALLALINPGEQEKSPCASLLAQASKKPVAPPPTKGVEKAVQANGATLPEKKAAPIRK